MYIMTQNFPIGEGISTNDLSYTSDKTSCLQLLWGSYSLPILMMLYSIVSSLFSQGQIFDLTFFREKLCNAEQFDIWPKSFQLHKRKFKHNRVGWQSNLFSNYPISSKPQHNRVVKFNALTAKRRSSISIRSFDS